MIKKFKTVSTSIEKPTEIQCDVCNNTYTTQDELDNFFHFYKDYDCDSLFSKEEYMADPFEEVEIEFDICQHCVKDLVEKRLSFNDELKKENADLRANVEYLGKELAIAQGYMRKMLDITVTMPEYNFKEYKK